MDRIVLLLENKGNRRLLADLLGTKDHAIAEDGPQALCDPFDLCVLDSLALTRLGAEIAQAKQHESPAFLPVLLVTSRHDVGVGTRRLWESVDELVASPIAKAELQARVEILLRARHLSLENARLRRQLEIEVERAARVQSALLPERPPVIPGFELAARCLAAREVGGDFYDWLEPRRGALMLTLGDVCGKGMPAALLMATIRATLRAAAAQNPPAAAVQIVERALAADFERSGTFVTLFHAQLAANERRLAFVDAGHGYAFVRRRNGAIETLPAGGMPLGAFPDQQYAEGHLVLEAGDALAVYSDGLVDARRDRSLGNADFAASLAGAASAAEMVEQLLELAAAPAKLPDDLTVLVLRAAESP
jgi:sigma-B regulation protein RsbU (phosphoserine phosphatase)